ncbi:hypothetical protein BH24ACT14_BH24ACT14_16580 [soil metagenome]
MDDLSDVDGHRSNASRLLLVVLAAAVAVLNAASPAAAHTALDATMPADGARVGPGLDRVVLRFTGPIDQDRVATRLRGPDGAVIDTAVPVIAEARVVLELPRLSSNGRHMLRYRVRAADGHPLDGRLRFTVRGAAGRQDGDGSNAEPTEADVDPSEDEAGAASEAPPTDNTGKASEPPATGEAGARGTGGSAAAGTAAPAGGSDTPASGGPSRWLLSLAAVVALAGGLAAAGIRSERRREQGASPP